MLLATGCQGDNSRDACTPTAGLHLWALRARQVNFNSYQHWIWWICIVQLEQLKVESPLWESKKERKKNKQTKNLLLSDFFQCWMDSCYQGEWERCQRCSCNLLYADQSVLTDPGWLKRPWDQSSLHCWNSFFFHEVENHWSRASQIPFCSQLQSLQLKYRKCWA